MYESLIQREGKMTVSLKLFSFALLSGLLLSSGCDAKNAIKITDPDAKKLIELEESIYANYFAINTWKGEAEITTFRYGDTMTSHIEFVIDMTKDKMYLKKTRQTWEEYHIITPDKYVRYAPRSIYPASEALGPDTPTNRVVFIEPVEKSEQISQLHDPRSYFYYAGKRKDSLSRRAEGLQRYKGHSINGIQNELRHDTDHIYTLVSPMKELLFEEIFDEHVEGNIISRKLTDYDGKVKTHYQWEWENIDYVFLPKIYKRYSNNRRPETTTVVLKNIAIGEKISPQLFTLEHLNLPEGCWVRDHRKKREYTWAGGKMINPRKLPLSYTQNLEQRIANAPPLWDKGRTRLKRSLMIGGAVLLFFAITHKTITRLKQRARGQGQNP
jgi:hypothetical protein